MHHIGDEERRARLARRHAIAPAHRVADPVAGPHGVRLAKDVEADGYAERVRRWLSTFGPATSSPGLPCCRCSTRR